VDLGPKLGHLTYSTLVHPGDTWAEMWDSINRYVPRVKARVCPDDRFGLSLRISGQSAEQLTADDRERAKLKQFIKDHDLYLYTANAFPQGAFKGRRVKEQVYEPDWRSDDRARYTMKVADILAEMAEEHIQPSIQTAPCGFKPRVTDDGVVRAYTSQLLRVVSHLIGLENKTGRTVTLAIEPEPACFLETTEETIAYFRDHLYSGAAIKTVADQSGVSQDKAERSLRKHLGTVYDICYQAVEYENISASLAALMQAGVPVFKLQEAAALAIPNVTPAKVDALRAYDDPVYLHQTIEKRDDGKRVEYLDLPEAFTAWDQEPGPREWRTHFHVPVFLEDLGAFRTTRFAIEDALRFHKQHFVSTQLEIETYTWDVLPDELKTGDIVDYVVRELEWVKGELAE
jgi:hypothetical protein